MSNKYINKFNCLLDSDSDNDTDNKQNDLDNSIKDNVIIKQCDDKNVKMKENVYIPPVSRNNTDWKKKKNTKKHRHLYKERKYMALEEAKDIFNNSNDLKGNNMRLNSIWTIWGHDNNNTNWAIESYNHIFDIDNIGKLILFFDIFGKLDKTVRQYYVMRQGITPIWEDNNNKQGGICSIMFEYINKRTGNIESTVNVDIFIAICILVLNESFVRNNMDINGLCYSIKNRNVLIKLWVKNYEQNIRFERHLPIVLLNKIDKCISLLDNGNNIFRNTKTNISVLFKKIEPTY
jgi:hypothetical protein